MVQSPSPAFVGILSHIVITITLNSACNEVTFNEKLAITKDNFHAKYTPFTYNDITLNKKPPITKQNLHIFFHYKQRGVYSTQ